MAPKPQKNIGSRAEVYHGNARQTSGGLTKKDLIKNKLGRIVSKKKFMTAKKEKRLEKYGFFAKKGKFGYVKGESKKNTTRKNNSQKGKKGKKGRKGSRAKK